MTNSGRIRRCRESPSFLSQASYIDQILTRPSTDSLMGEFNLQEETSPSFDPESRLDTETQAPRVISPASASWGQDHEISDSPSSPQPEQHTRSNSPRCASGECITPRHPDEEPDYPYVDDFSGYKTSEPYDGQGSSSGGRYSATEQGTSGFNSLALPSQGKRKSGPNNDKEGNQDEDDNGGFKRPRIYTPSSATSLPYCMKFACPYQKGDPSACHTCGLPRTKNRQEPGFRDFHRVV